MAGIVDRVAAPLEEAGTAELTQGDCCRPGLWGKRNGCALEKWLRGQC